MLHPFFIFLLSFTFFNLDLENLLVKKTHASSILILPEKRPHIINDYNYSLGTINDMILKEGGKTIGKIFKQKIKKDETLSFFLNGKDLILHINNSSSKTFISGLGGLIPALINRDPFPAAVKR